MSLDDWLRAGWIVRHKPDAKEIAKLLRIADRDLADSQVWGLSADAKLGHAYHAALQSAACALAATGFRASRDAYHMRVLRSLAYTVALDEPTVDLLDTFRKKRNFGDYTEAGLVSVAEADEMVALALRIRAAVEAWQRKHHPELLL